jgi:5'-3' exonuclease
MQADRLLVIVDFSWWLNLAFRVAGVEGMAPIVVGRFVELLRGEVAACLAIALDSVGPTWRHDMTEGLPAELAYKGHREPKPREFYALSNRLIDVVRLHRVPILAAEGWEADDAIAAGVRLAQGAGLDVAILTADKDLGQLVAPGVVLWDGAQRVRDEAAILAEWGVEPAQLGDLLAIVGDASDNIRGVESLGPTKAANILGACGDLETALAIPPEPVSPEAIKAAEKAREKAKRSGAAQPLDAAQRDLEGLREARDLARDLTILQAHAADVRRARQLVQLDAQAPIEWDLRELPVGGYDVAGIRRAYLSLGFHNLASDVRGFPKAPPPGADEDEQAEPARDSPATRAQFDGHRSPVEPRPAPSSERQRATGEGAAEGPPPVEPPVLRANIAGRTEEENGRTEELLVLDLLRRSETWDAKRLGFAIEDVGGKKAFPRINAELRADALAELRRRLAAREGRAA